MDARDWVGSMAKRNLRRIPSFEPGEAHDLDPSLNLSDDESIVGRYVDRSGPASESYGVVVTDCGLHVHEDDEWKSIRYSNIERSSVSLDKTAFDGVDVTLRDGQTFTLPITGARGNFRDRYPFSRFLDRAVSMTRKYSQR